MVESEREQKIVLPVCERQPVTRHPEPHRRQRSTGVLAKTDVDDLVGVVHRDRGGPPRIRAADLDRHPLREALAGSGTMGIAERDRRAVRLERGVGPVALVLHLERVAFHATFRGDTGAHLMGDRAHLLERLPRLDKVWQLGPDDPAVDMLDRHRRAGQSDDRMQHAEAAARRLEVASRRGRHVELERAVGR